MNRVASTTLLLAAAALLATRLISSADSSQIATDRAPMDAGADQIPPELVAVNAQVERLRDRLPAPTDFPTPRRDPFNFGERRQTRGAAPAPPMAFVDLPVPALPKLIAILSEKNGGVEVRTAVIAKGDDVEFVKTGGAVGNLRVSAITSDGIVLTEPASGLSFSLALQ
jgi:hypothetical protein